MNTNQVKIQGRIVRIYDNGKGLAIVTVSTSTKRDTRDYPSVVFLGKQDVALVNQYKAGDQVTIKGHFADRRVPGAQGENYHMETYIRGEAIVASESMMRKKFNLEAGGRYPTSAEFSISGELIRFGNNVHDNWVTMLIRVNANQHITIVRASYYVRDKAAFMNTYQLHDNVCLYGGIQTEVKDRNTANGTEKAYYTNYIIHEISKAE